SASSIASSMRRSPPRPRHSLRKPIWVSRRCSAGELCGVWPHRARNAPQPDCLSRNRYGHPHARHGDHQRPDLEAGESHRRVLVSIGRWRVGWSEEPRVAGSSEIPFGHLAVTISLTRVESGSLPPNVLARTAAPTCFILGLVRGHFDR